jgi:hypothetical protein
MESKIIQKQREEMKKVGFDGLVSISPENTTYTAGVAIPSQSLIRQRHVICLVPESGAPKPQDDRGEHGGEFCQGQCPD